MKPKTVHQTDYQAVHQAEHQAEQIEARKPKAEKPKVAGSNYKIAAWRATWGPHPRKAS